MVQKKRTQWEFIILACMYVGYMAFLLCRTTLQVSGPEMIADPDLGLTKTLYGQILAWGTAGMVVGKLTTGVIADALGGRKVFLIALLLVALMAIAMGFSGSYPAFALAQFVMLFAAAAGWPAMASLISAWYPPTKFGKVWGLISTSSRLSSMLSLFLLGLLISYFNWKNIFHIGGAIGLLVLVIIFFFLKARPTDVGLTETEVAYPPADSSHGKKSHLLDHKSAKEALGIFARNRRFWLMCASLMTTTILMEFIGFIPLYLNESFGVAASAAAKATSVFPAGCLLALVVGGFIYDGISRRGRMFLLGGMLITSTLCISLLWILPSLQISADLRFAFAVGILFCLGVTLAPSYYLPMSIFSIEFGGPHCGLLIGLIDATGYLASMSYQYVGGRMVDSWGWPSMLTLLFACSLIAIVVTIWFSFEDAREVQA